MKTPTITPEDLRPDPRNDQVGRLLQKLEKHGTWTKEKRCLLGELLKELRTGRRAEFVSDYSKYQLAKVGASALYDVPLNKRGHLSRFRGETIRLICIGSGSHFVREYIAKPIESSEIARRHRRRDKK